jgi:penicillin amidase
VGTRPQIQETVRVRDSAPQSVSLQFTRHGPVLYIDKTRHKAYALRSAWGEPGTSVYFGALRYQKARNLQDYSRAIAHWRAPTLNHVYADVTGKIAWQAAGYIPRRPNHDGLLPVPGDGRFEWQGFIRPPEMPSRINPRRGF